MAEEDNFWFWYGDNGEFKAFDTDIMARLEEARRRGVDQVSVQLGPHQTPYILKIASLEQTNEDTDHTRPITKATALWYWQDDDNQNWNRYNPEDSLQLALADLSNYERSTCLVRGDSTYFVDVERLVQRNIGTDYERAIWSGSLPAAAATANSDNGSPLPVAAAAFAAALPTSTSTSTPDSDDDSAGSSDPDPPELLQQAPEAYVCPLSNRIMRDPVSTLEGSTYERKKIKRHLRLHNGDPLTGNVLQNKTLTENRSLRHMIEWWRDDRTRQRTSRLAGGAHAMPSMVRRANSAPAATSVFSRSLRMSQQAPIVEIEALPTIDFTDTHTSMSTKKNASWKIMCLGLSNIGSDVAFRHPTNANRKPGINRYNWSLQSTQDESIRLECNVYDFVGQQVHHASQKVFFSPRSVYVIVWDMGASNPDTFPSNTVSNTAADAAIKRDIFDRVQFWVDAIQQVAPKSLIVPVVSLDGSFGGHNAVRQNAAIEMLQEDEIKRRCMMLKGYFEERAMTSEALNIFFGPDDDPVPRAGSSSDRSDGLKSLKGLLLHLSVHSEMVVAPSSRPPAAASLLLQKVRLVIAEMSHGGSQIVALDHFLSNASFLTASTASTKTRDEQLCAALEWLSGSGEIIYFGWTGDVEGLQDSDALGNFIVLDPDWIVTALAKVLRADIHDSHHGPVATNDNLRALWKLWLRTHGNFDMEEVEEVLDFLYVLFTLHEVLVPLNAQVNSSAKSNTEIADLVFLPGLLGPGEHGKSVKLYEKSEFSKTVLAHSLQLQSMVSPVLLERVCTSVLNQVYARANNDDGRNVSEGQLFVKNIFCWRTLLYFKLGLYTRTSDGAIQASVVDIYCHLVDASSDLCVGATFLGGTNQSLVLSAKGEEGNDAEVIWRGGYDFISEAAKQAVEKCQGIIFERHFFCPSCLAQTNLRDTRGWNEWVLQRSLIAGEAELSCDSRHTEKMQMLLGQSATRNSTENFCRSTAPPDVPAEMLMPGVVMVGLYDENRSSKKIQRIGSGFIIDGEKGLIVTAAHNLMKLWYQEDFGLDYDGIKGAKAVIGIIPDEKKSDGTYPPAVFRYFAKIVKKDSNLVNNECHVDACILQITSRFESDVDGNGDLCGKEISVSLVGEPALMKEQNLLELSVSETSQIGESIRILGFDQPDTSRVNRSVGFSAGSVYKHFECESVGGVKFRYTPRKKTILTCSTIIGHSGGPCVNQAGQVIGILSCADFTERSRSYLAPTSEWIKLIPKRAFSSFSSNRSKSVGIYSSTII